MDNHMRIKQMKELLEQNDDIFEEFNTTSVMILFYSCLEIYGQECKELAIQVLRRFVDWCYIHKNLYYMPNHGLEPMYHPKVIEHMLNWCEQQDEYICKEDAMTRFFTEFNKVENDVLINEKTKTKNKYIYGTIIVIAVAILYKHFR